MNSQVKDDEKKTVITLELSEEATTKIFQAARGKGLLASSDQKTALLQELKELIDQEGLENLVEGVSTSTKFNLLMMRGN